MFIAAKSSSSGLTFLPILLILVVMYFILIRPQQQRARRARQVGTTLGVGDEVVTASGIIGRVIAIDGERAELEVAPGVVLTMLRAALTRKANEAPMPPPPPRGRFGGLFAPPRPPASPAGPTEHDADHDHDVDDDDEEYFDEEYDEEYDEGEEPDASEVDPTDEETQK